MMAIEREAKMKVPGLIVGHRANKEEQGAEVTYQTDQEPRVAIVGGGLDTCDGVRGPLRAAVRR
ncbi:hypothetical protein Asi02nite_77930 [Asanoa siamensis]|uniref:Uncharacterized protein n=1 Tax=Asanoa siamensis TaxID=926357 RepID=A0ABQ4D413_9ACTN|nr:hypothetical protein Asi02nite_77930 [Asanoa siamensis]